MSSHSITPRAIRSCRSSGSVEGDQQTAHTVPEIDPNCLKLDEKVSNFFINAILLKFNTTKLNLLMRILLILGKLSQQFHKLPEKERPLYCGTSLRSFFISY